MHCAVDQPVLRPNFTYSFWCFLHFSYYHKHSCYAIIKKLCTKCRFLGVAEILRSLNSYHMCCVYYCQATQYVCARRGRLWLWWKIIHILLRLATNFECWNTSKIFSSHSITTGSKINVNMFSSAKHNLRMEQYFYFWIKMICSCKQNIVSSASVECLTKNNVRCLQEHCWM